MSAEQLKNQIIQKAWEDAEFKKKLLEDPKTAVKDAFGIEVPDDIKIDVIEETTDHYYLVLPQNPADVQDDDQVEAPMW